MNGQDLGKHPTVLKLMKGAGTWDVDLVIHFFKSAPPNKELSLIQLSLKTAMLLALVTMFRFSELAAIDSASQVFQIVVFSSVYLILGSRKEPHLFSLVL